MRQPEKFLISPSSGTKKTLCVAMSIYRGRSTKEFYLASALYDSIEDLNSRAVISLIREKGADANIVLPGKGISPFHLAIGSENDDFAMQVTTLILQHGGDPNVRSDEGLTPLHISAAWGRPDMVKLLLSCGADPDIKDYSYMTAADYAHEEQNHEIVKLLRDHISIDAASFFNRGDKKDGYKLFLDKILINNGQAIGEYEFIKTEPEMVSDTIDLKILPQTTPDEYVLNWCKTLESQLENMHLTSDDTKNLSASDDSVSGPMNFNNVTYYRPNATRPINLTGTKNDNISYKEHPLKDFCVFNEKSRLSGITPLADSAIEDCNADAEELKLVAKVETSSDYFTCTDVSENVNALEQNIFEVSSSISSNKSVELNDALIMTSVETDLSFVSVSEVYKYMDHDEGVVLFEKRLLPPAKISSNDSECITVSSGKSSKLSSLPRSFDYDTDVLRKELTYLGFEPGPITNSTKKVYLRKLYNLKRKSYECPVPTLENKKVFSHELQKTLKDPKWTSDLTPYRILEETVSKQFANPEPNRKWREGINKSSFTYLLLDPRITQNLPCRTENVPEAEQWSTFLSSIFYVGKGKRSRPYQHLYEAVSLHTQGIFKSNSDKLQKILDIWQDNCGVICLHIYQNVIPVEAYTREAAMISALKLDNLDNVKSGDFYGVAATWNWQQKRHLGVYLLYKAMKIFLQEGERQLCPNHID